MKLYLAGPDVFRPDALAWAEEARRLCAAAGHRALVPLDGVETTASGIYRANIALIREAARQLVLHDDAVMATLAHPIHDHADFVNPNVVKVVTDLRGYARIAPGVRVTADPGSGVLRIAGPCVALGYRGEPALTQSIRGIGSVDKD